MARRPRLPTREVRLGALGARLAEASSIVADFASDEPPPKRIRTFSEAAPDDLSVALHLLGLVGDLGLVVHGPRGCAVGAAQERIAVTDLDQRDTVLGSGEALFRALKRLDAAIKPAALIVLGSPVIAINNDEIRAVVAEAAESLGKPVVWARTDGFRSAIAATGADAAAEALLSLIEASEKEPDLVNLLTPWSGPAIDEIIAAIEGLGLRVNVLPAAASVADVRRAARAIASLVVDPDGLDALAGGLAARFGVPRLDAPLPIGPEATLEALTRLAALAGRPAPAPRSPVLLSALQGRRIVLAAPAAFAFAFADLAEAAGAEVIALTAPHLDRTHAEALARFAARRPKAQLHVGDAQGFERANVLKRLAPDLLIGAADAVAAALRSGIPAARLDPAAALGFGGAAALERAASDALAGAALAERLSRRSARYSSAWLRRSPDWHVKLEVK